MPKMKTHKATVKRTKVTGGGKIMRRPAGGAHLRAKMSSKNKRRVAVPMRLADVDQKRIAKLINSGGQL
jgi:large subunit ribosomal protein L35